MSKNYSILRQVKITADHLDSNAYVFKIICIKFQITSENILFSTIHKFILGALAEIVDNSRFVFRNI